MKTLGFENIEVIDCTLINEVAKVKMDVMRGSVESVIRRFKEKRGYLPKAVYILNGEKWCSMSESEVNEDEGTVVFRTGGTI